MRKISLDSDVIALIERLYFFYLSSEPFVQFCSLGQMLDVLVVTGYIYHLLASMVHHCACIQRLHFTDKLTLTPQLFVVISAIEFFFLDKVKNQLAKVSDQVNVRIFRI